MTLIRTDVKEIRTELGLERTYVSALTHNPISRGPTAENRLKLDIVAPGTAILSARSQNKKFLGAVHLTGESEDSNICTWPELAWLRLSWQVAVLFFARFSLPMDIGMTASVGGQYMPGGVNEGYNVHSWFGRVDLAASVPRSDDTYSGYGIGVAHEDDEDFFTYTVNIPRPVEGDNGSLKLKATMVYADRPGGKLQHDLNLVVASGELERHGNQVSKPFPLGATEGLIVITMSSK
ncbi:hypothetical protein FCIRC_7687 [Fusarium circinatum]|uniref:Uncharacterized protein n=1 Tax=Fusarium circinatum TaxID=48490 RepID=A0A8H5TSA9_FUSCI|nr:hypothetical protein FCIRC_7687 [Fusarium circinatum]